MSRASFSLLILIPLMTLLHACAPWRVAADDAPQPVTYVAIGASDTVGVGARDPVREGWVPRLHAQLPAGSTLTNLGISGSLLNQALDQQLPVALAAQPDLVTVWLAVNDLNAGVPLERYTADLDRLLQALRGGGATVLIGNVPDVAQLPMYRGLDPSVVRMEVAAWNSAIATIAARHGATVVDLYSGWRELAEHPEYVSGDGFHPSSAGYARMAEMFLATLESSGGLQPAPRD